MAEKYVKLMSETSFNLMTPSKQMKTSINLSFNKHINIYYSHVFKQKVMTINSGNKSILLDRKTFLILKNNFKKISQKILS